MSATEYSEFLVRVDNAVTHWTNYYQKIDAAKIPISYEKGNEVMKLRNVALDQLSKLHDFVIAEKARPRLWRQMMMATMIMGQPDGFVAILWMLPQDSVPSEWDQNFLKMSPEARDLSLPLLNHVQKRADLLEP